MSSPTLAFQAKVEKGKLIIEDYSSMLAIVEMYEGRHCTLHITKRRKAQTKDQRGLLYGHIIPKVTIKLVQLGWEVYGAPFTVEDTETWLISEFAKYDTVNAKTGEVRTITKSVSMMSQDELTQFIAKIKQWAEYEESIALKL